MERKLKSAYTRTRVVTDVGERKTKCVQSEKKASDINNIVGRAFQTGQLPVLMNRKHIEALPDVESYQDALNRVVFAQQKFEQLPSNIRAKFENKPEKMLEAISASSSDPDLKKQLQTIGILEAPPHEPPKRPSLDSEPPKRPSLDPEPPASPPPTE